MLPTNGEKKTVYKRTTLDHNGYMEAKNPPMAFKPMIYLYPEEDNTLVRVKLGSKEKISTSYPKYVDGWSVIAEKNGTLKLENSDREYYGLYWEGLNDIEEKFDEGFCISGKESAEFLEEKLRILGLNDKEAEEFIVYWLPKLEESKYNLIRFETIDEINENMALEISPKPDTIIRIIMDFKGIESPVNVKEQKLEEVKREGFTVVEWGGTEIY